MTTYKLKLDCGNAAFGDDDVMTRGAEVARILRETADRVEHGSLGGNLFDMNGNRVGAHRFYPD